jgi:hypothetical protein
MKEDRVWNERWSSTEGGVLRKITSGSPNKAGFLLKSAYQGMTLDGVE